MGRRKENIVFEQVEVSSIGSEGKSIARVDGYVLFVDGCIPGDVVDVQTTRRKSGYAEAVPLRFHRYSSDRTTPFCKHFGVCGGCKWQHLSYDKQLFYKQKQVTDNLERIGKVPLPPATPILAANPRTQYRNKLEFTFTDSRWLTDAEIKSEDGFDRNGLGFHLPGRFDRVLDLDECHLQGGASEDIRKALRGFAKESGLPFFNIRDQQGFLRNLIVRTASTGQLMALVQFYEDRPADIEKVMAFLKGRFPEITSLLYVVNPKANDTLDGLEPVCYAGNSYIEEEMEGLVFRVGPKSFYQTNSAQAYNLYKIARSYAALTGVETVYDLYTGTGTIANFIARHAKTVIGMEYVAEAVDDARENARRNNIINTSFYAGDIKTLLTPGFLEAHPAPDVVVTDPPRAGMHADVTAMLLRAAPKRIVYVSCNPATQARDIQLLSEAYDVAAYQPVDMFPHTYHVENVALLIRKPQAQA